MGDKMILVLPSWTPGQVLEVLGLCKERVAWAQAQARHALTGRRVRIIADWRDQPHGKSKPNLKGKEFAIDTVFLDDDGCAKLLLEGTSCYIDLTDVQLL